MPDCGAVVSVEAVDDIGIGVFVLDVPLGGEVPDGPVDRVLIQKPAQSEILTSERERSRVAALVVLDFATHRVEFGQEREFIVPL